MINLTNVKFAYNKSKVLFNNLNLNIVPGGIYGLLGKNGAGKSTLLKLLSGALFPDSGLVQVFNTDSVKRDKGVFQEIYLLTEDDSTNSMTGDDYLRVYSKFYPRFAPAKFERIIKEWKIQCDKKLTHLSGGERKKFFIAFAFSTNCKLIFLDEPTNGLDIPSKDVFRRLLASSVCEDTALIISSHQVRDLDGLIDPVIILDNGQVIINQTMASIEEKLVFSLSSNISETDKCLYRMQTVGGWAYTSIRQDEYQYSNKADLELLFNAVINNRTEISHIFGEQSEL